MSRIINVKKPCECVPSVLNHVRTGDEVKFVNQTDSKVTINFSNDLIFDSGPLELAPGESGVVTVKGISVECMIDCNIPQDTAVAGDTKPQVVVNRD